MRVTRHIAADAQLRQVEVESGYVAVLQFVNVRCLFEFILRIMPRGELQRRADFGFKTHPFAVLIGQFHKPYIGAVAVFLRLNIEQRR